MGVPGTQAEVLAAASKVDPKTLTGSSGLLHPGVGLEIQVTADNQIRANLWSRGARSTVRGPILRGAVEQQGAMVQIRGTLSWSRIVLPLLLLPLLIPALFLTDSLRASVWPGWQNILLGSLCLGAVCALVIGFGALRWPKRFVQEEQDLRDALLHALDGPRTN